MTIWKPQLPDDGTPIYLALADVLSRDVESGRLKAGGRLPTHRELAERLGVTVGTITRGYEEARRRGLVTGEVGRGTFVRGPRFEVPVFDRGETPGGVIDLSLNHPYGETGKSEILAAMREAEGDLDLLLGYQPYAGITSHRDAGLAWIADRGVNARADEILVTSGAQHGLLIAFATLLKPGDVVLCEHVTYQGMKALARLLGLRLEAVPMDADGIIPSALDEACQRFRPRALYCTPTVQNPTGRIFSAKRREEIAGILERSRVLLVEDDIYSFLAEEAPPAITSLIPDLGLYVTSLSKSIAPGLRVGFLRAPAGFVKSLSAAMMTTAVMASPITAEIAARMIRNGTARRIVAERRAEASRRRELADEILAPHIAEGIAATVTYVWLNLPEPWRAEEFAAQARSNGVLVASADNFAVGRAAAPHAVRVSLCAPAAPEMLERGLRVLGSILDGAPIPAMAGF